MPVWPLLIPAQLVPLPLHPKAMSLPLRQRQIPLNPGTNVTNTGMASATDTGVNVKVPVPSTTPVTEDDDAYVFTDANNKEIEVKTSEYDSWTPAQQLAWQTSQGLISQSTPAAIPGTNPMVV